MKHAIKWQTKSISRRQLVSFYAKSHIVLPSFQSLQKAMFWHYGHTSHNKSWQTSTNSHRFVPIDSDTYVIARAITKHQAANTTLIPSVIVTDGSHLDNFNRGREMFKLEIFKSQNFASGGWIWLSVRSSHPSWNLDIPCCQVRTMHAKSVPTL